MTQELSGRVAIVTGAGRNIGRAIALALAEAGAAIMVNARSNLKEAEAVADEIERAGGKALATTADVIDADAVTKMVTSTASRFGRIDILVNNAAVRAEQPLETMTLADWRAVTGVILDKSVPTPSQAQRRGRSRKHRRPLRPYRRCAPRACRGSQSRAYRIYARAGARARARQDPREYGDAGLDGDAAPRGTAAAAASFACALTRWPAWGTLGYRCGRAVPVRPGGELHYRAKHPGKRRHVFGLAHLR